MPKKPENPWKGEARRIRTRVLGAINSRIPKNCVSTLGRMTYRRDPNAAPSLYAEAMGWDLETALAAINRQHETLRAAGQPFRMK